MIVMVPICVFAHPLFCYRSCFYCDLHSFPTRRSSDLGTPALIGRHDASVLEIALDHGFASAATFARAFRDWKSTRLNSSHITISYAVFCLKKKKKKKHKRNTKMRKSDKDMIKNTEPIK